MKKPLLFGLLMTLAPALWAQRLGALAEVKLAPAAPSPALQPFVLRSEQLMAIQALPLVQTSEPPEPYMDQLTYAQGVPKSVRLLSADEVAATTFRHYGASAGIDSIVKGSSLRGGSTPYVQAAGARAWKIFNDLSGIFLTLPDLKGTEVGVSAKKADYVDVKLAPGTPVLEIEPGKILLVPSPAPGLDLPVTVSRRR